MGSSAETARSLRNPETIRHMSYVLDKDHLNLMYNEELDYAKDCELSRKDAPHKRQTIITLRQGFRLQIHIRTLC